MKLTDEQVALVKGALWAIGNDMTEGFDEDWFDDADPDNREDFDMADNYNDRNGHKLCDILRALLEENGKGVDASVYEAKYYVSDIENAVTEILTNDGADIEKADIKGIVKEIKQEVSDSLYGLEEYPNKDDFDGIVKEAVYKRYGLADDGELVVLE